MDAAVLEYGSILRKSLIAMISLPESQRALLMAVILHRFCDDAQAPSESLPEYGDARDV